MSRSSPSVLVVDDDWHAASLVKVLLEGVGIKVAVAHSAHDALETLGLNSRSSAVQLPDLVILDYHMPLINGYEILRRLRQADRHRQVHVIMVTATNKRIKEIVEPDIDEFLSKPVDNQTLVDTVTRVLGYIPAVAEAAAPSGQDPAPAPALEIEHFDRNETPATLDTAAEPSVVDRVDEILADGIERKASDVHFEPQDNALVVRMRLEGTLHITARLPVEVVANVSARLKVLSGLDISERRIPQDGRFRKLGRSGEIVEFRVNTLPGIHGEKIVLRLLRQDALAIDWNSAPMRASDRQSIEGLLSATQGMILVTGPTGSGKTTTLYSMINRLNTAERNIITVEDPVEYQIRGVNQVAVNADIGLTFDKVLRSILRQDPNVILVGEMRDLETAEIGLRAAMTGHLVLSTLHTNSAAATVVRLLNMGIKPFIIAAALKAVIAQRLVRLLCPHCKKPAQLPSDKTSLIGDDLSKIKSARLYGPQGCDKCLGTGYLGRKPVYEVMTVVTPTMRKLIGEGVEEDIMFQALREGMVPIKTSILELVASGETAPDEGFKFLVSE